MKHTIHAFKAKLHKDIKDGMKLATERNTYENYEKVSLLLGVEEKLCKVMPSLIESNKASEVESITVLDSSYSATSDSIKTSY